jgi:hypothetical protein
MMITWQMLVECAPELARIQAQVKRLRRDPRYWQYYESFKSDISRLVGWEADPRLPEWMRTSEAYIIALQTIF